MTLGHPVEKMCFTIAGDQLLVTNCALHVAKAALQGKKMSTCNKLNIR